MCRLCIYFAACIPLTGSHQYLLSTYCGLDLSLVLEPQRPWGPACRELRVWRRRQTQSQSPTRRVIPEDFLEAAAFQLKPAG